MLAASSPAPGFAIPERIFVNGFAAGTTEADLRSAFALAGVPVGYIEMVLNRSTGFPRGFAFIDLLAGCDVRASQIHSADVNGQTLKVLPIPGDRAGRKSRRTQRPREIVR